MCCLSHITIYFDVNGANWMGIIMLFIVVKQVGAKLYPELPTKFTVGNSINAS